MANHSDVRFAVDYTESNVKKEDLKGFDLCVLGTSHHTVISLGTFGIWGALLSGGDAIASKGRNKEKLLWVRTFLVTIC